MSKLLITLKVNKITKSKIKDRTYKNKDNQDVTDKELKIQLVELKEPKVVAEGTGKGGAWKLVKTHFVVEEKENEDDKDVFIGEAVQFQTEHKEENKAPEQAKDEIDFDAIPF
jgi:hypothetical protein